MQELYLLTPMLIKTINDYLKTDQIQHIRFRAAVKKNYSKQHQQANAPVEKPKRPLTNKEQTALAKIEDPQLRSILESFLFRCGD